MEPNTTELLIYITIEGGPVDRAIKLVNILHKLGDNPAIAHFDWEPVSS